MSAPRAAWLLALMMLPASAAAHQPSDSFLRLDASSETLSVDWDIALRDLEMLVGLDADDDRAITWGELRRRRDAVAAHARQHLSVRAGTRDCALVLDELLVDEHAGNGYAVLRFDTGCPGNSALHIHYSLLFESDPQHRGLLRIDYPDRTITSVFAPDRRQQRFDTDTPSAGAGFIAYLSAGVVHIWRGLDHLLFLLCLLLPAVLRRIDGRWRPVTHFRPALWQTVRVVTAFTVAHSITLALAALGVVALPSRLVEASIAASIVFAAGNNLVPLIRQHVWSVAFVFGLLHGFGFASALQDLGLDGAALALGLLGFNLGVEAGQLCIVAAWLPLSYALRGSPLYRPVVLYAGSVAIAVAGLAWFVQRVG